MLERERESERVLERENILLSERWTNLPSFSVVPLNTSPPMTSSFGLRQMCTMCVRALSPQTLSLLAWFNCCRASAVFPWVPNVIVYSIRYTWLNHLKKTHTCCVAICIKQERRESQSHQTTTEGSLRLCMEIVWRLYMQCMSYIRTKL